jgi:hypothetical protein
VEAPFAAIGKFAWHWAQPASLPWSVLPLAVYVFGTMVAMPSLTLMGLDLKAVNADGLDG